MKCPKHGRKVLIQGTLFASTILAVSVVLYSFIWRPGPHSIKELIDALHAHRRIHLSEADYKDIQEDIRSCSDPYLLESCIEAFGHHRELDDPDTENRLASIWDGHCVIRLGSLGRNGDENAIEVLVRMLDYADGGLALSLGTVLTQVGKPAIGPLSRYEGPNTRFRDEILDAIRVGYVLGP